MRWRCTYGSAQQKAVRWGSAWRPATHLVVGQGGLAEGAAVLDLGDGHVADALRHGLADLLQRRGARHLVAAVVKLHLDLWGTGVEAEVSQRCVTRWRWIAHMAVRYSPTYGAVPSGAPATPAHTSTGLKVIVARAQTAAPPASELTVMASAAPGPPFGAAAPLGAAAAPPGGAGGGVGCAPENAK